MFSTPGQDAGTPKQGAYAGGMDQAGKCPAFPSPRKQENNGLSGEELGTQMAAEDLMRLSKLGKVYFSGKQQERVTFQYVFNDKLITCCGDVAERLLGVNGKNGYTEKECEALTIWQGTYMVLEAMHKELQTKGPVEAHSLLLTDVWGGVIAPTLKW